MSNWRTTLAAGLVALSWIAASPVSAQGLPELMPGCQLTLENDPERVLVETPLGTLTLQLFPSVAPVTVANFLGYIERGDYADTIVHRVVPGDPGPEDDFVIQAGGFAGNGTTFAPIETQAPIANEPCISNLAGTIAMAKLGSDPDSATSQWFVNLNDNSANLDNQNEGFTAFGRVLDDGLAVATAIVNLADSPRLIDVNPQSGAFDVLVGSPLLGPLVDPGGHGCFDASQSGVLLTENAMGVDLEPGTVQDVPFALTSTACAGAGAGGSPGFACNPPGRRVLLLDPDTLVFEIDPCFPPRTPEQCAAENPLGLLEEFLSCEEIAASEAAFTTRLEDLALQFDSLLVKTTYTVTVPEPSADLSAGSCLLGLAAMARIRRRRRR